MNRWHIAQINVGTARYALDDPGMAEFMARLNAINALADQSPGFVCRLQSDAGNATDIQAGDNTRFIVNMSVWCDAQALFDFVYKTAHRLVMAKRRQWFERPAGAYQALWWLRAGELPTVAEGLARLEHLDREGPSPFAFTFQTRFAPPDVVGPAKNMRPEPYCVGWA